MGLRIREIVIDCARPAALARFWAAALGAEVRAYDDEEVARLAAKGITDLEDDPTVAVDTPDGGGTLFFQRVPEGKVVKNRLHLDLLPDTSMEAEVRRLLGLGASVLEELEEEGRRWTLMQDPEGNELCVQSPP